MHSDLNTRNETLTTFKNFQLSDALLKSLEKMNYKTPTEIQVRSIPIALKGRDILGSAQTGTGKTAAFSIPLVEILNRSDHSTALILTPTRELAKQIMGVIHDILGHQNHLRTAFIIGGESMSKQLNQLKKKPRIIVGTPGRMNDHLEKGTLDLSQTCFLVLDETDRMLDMGFGKQLDKIVEFIPEERQTLLFSATLPKSIVQLSQKYLNNAQRIAVETKNNIPQNITQDTVLIDQRDKYIQLVAQLKERQGTVIVFVKTKHGAERIKKRLKGDGFDADALHGDMRQNQRTRVMRNLHDYKFRVLVATDVAARGLDVPHIEHVINYDLPQVPEDYIHRIGRTARNGAKGEALSFVAPHDKKMWGEIQKLINPEQKKQSQPQKKTNSKKTSSTGYKRKKTNSKANNKGQQKKKKKNFEKSAPKTKGGFKKKNTKANKKPNQRPSSIKKSNKKTSKKTNQKSNKR